MNDNIKEKLRQAEKNINEIEFVVKYKGNKLHSALIPIPQYAEDVFNENVSYYLFFKDLTAKLKDKIDKDHQRIFFEKQDPNRGPLVDKFAKKED
jgi:hypothetical protein